MPWISTPLSFCFFFYASVDHRALHSFPTRRSSDLQRLRRAIGWVDARMPGGANCNRRALLEISLDSGAAADPRSEEHTSELQSRQYLVCRLLLEKKKTVRWQIASERSGRVPVILDV